MTTVSIVIKVYVCSNSNLMSWPMQDFYGGMVPFFPRNTNIKKGFAMDCFLGIKRRIIAPFLGFFQLFFIVFCPMQDLLQRKDSFLSKEHNIKKGPATDCFLGVKQPIIASFLPIFGLFSAVSHRFLSFNLQLCASEQYESSDIILLITRKQKYVCYAI